MLSDWECRKRWKCPTDRELAIRAKINKGWSIHTANAFLKPDAFDLKELETIGSVIQRANDLERLEVERVERMIYKLENMTRNAVGDGDKTCSMCGTTFGIFRSSYVECTDCGKAVCEKCRVDTLTPSLDICMLCKICSEDRELWKKSGGWFYGKLPTMTEACQKKSESQSSASPSPVRAFDTWSHRAPDIVRLQSYEPPEENHNDQSQYTSWTIIAAEKDIAKRTVENAGISENETDYSHHKDYVVISQTEKRCSDSLELLEKKRRQHELKISSIPDLHSLKDRDTPPFIELESFRKLGEERNQPVLNYLSVQSTKLSSSCPTLTDFKEPCKLRRKASIRRKRTSAPTRGKMQDK